MTIFSLASFSHFDLDLGPGKTIKKKNEKKKKSQETEDDEEIAALEAELAGLVKGLNLPKPALASPVNNIPVSVPTKHYIGSLEEALIGPGLKNKIPPDDEFYPEISCKAAAKMLGGNPFERQDPPCY